MARRILVVEDEAPIREMVCFVLEQNGFQPVEAEDYDSAVNQLNEPWPDLILLDWMLPGGSGLQFIKHLKREALTRDIPVVMLTARGEEEDRVRGLETGADDYIVKPFSPGEVMARIRAVLRRIPAAAEKEMLVIGELSIHLPSLSVTLSGHKLNLTRREVELLYTLAASPGRVFTRDNLLTIVWGYEFAGNYRAVDSHIKRLRAKLDAYPHDTFTIATVWGAGYKFERKLP